MIHRRGIRAKQKAPRPLAKSRGTVVFVPAATGQLEIKPLQDLVAREAMVLGDASDDGGERPHLEKAGARNRLVMLTVQRRPEADVGTLEFCTLRVLNRLFSSSQIRQCYPRVVAQRQRIYAWHYSVLAKSYLWHHRVDSFCRLASGALWSHLAALRFLTRGGMGAP